MPRVRAIEDFVGHKKGDEFNLSDEEARILSAPDLLGGQKVELVDDEVKTRAMTTEDDSSLTSAGNRKGKYNRRDMRARE